MVTLYHLSVMPSTSIDGMRQNDSESLSPAFGAWLASEVRSHGLNQGEFARRVGVSATTVSRWLKGRVPKGRYIEQIADVLLLDVDQVLTRSGYRPRDLEVDPESPQGRIMALTNRVQWTDERAAMIEAQLRQMIEIDRTRRGRQ